MKSIPSFSGIKTILFTLFIGFSFSFYANNHIPTKSYFDHLSEVNKEWSHHKEAAPEGLISFNSDLDRIQLHLNLVIDHLKTNSPSNFNSDQISNRLTLLDKLQDYADNKVFPINKYHSIRTPYFVDHLGTNCAVGQMIYVSGNEDLVAKISKEHNYDYLKDTLTEGVVEWAKEFGFTLDELKWIQPAYPPTQTMDQVLDGTNGKVNKILRHYSGEKLTIAGEFTELDGSPCLNIGFYENNQLSCYGNGLDGKINDILHLIDGIYAFGEFTHSGEVFPIAKFDGTNWNYIGIPNRIGATASVANFGGSGYNYEVAIAHSSIPNHQEIWHFMNNNTWERQAKVNGIINDILASGYGRVHVGNFDSVIVYNSNATIDTSLSVNNVVISKYYEDVWHGISGEISETINIVKEIGGALIFGGTCVGSAWGNDVCISRYFNSVLQPLYLNDHQFLQYSVNTIAYNYGDKFTFGGDFEIDPGIGTYGINLANFNLISNSIEPLADLDQPVNSLIYFGEDLYIGGDFQNNLGSPINYLGKMSSTVGLNENTAEINLNVYPNPFNSIINLEGIEEGAKYSILYIDGRVAKSGTVMNEKINDLDFLPKGSYLLQLESMKGNIVRKIFK
ncbi:T9SS type A sorting domain-containing protein [Brumimicrobium glaciale]|uniref:T9SS type A sorting domain-containing protein n=1 Tax=Brumimicrobium glaciale TaxID=200475 RepID=A0A4Q4KHD1_9FLAO|nr:T9SS type A sorting domain-containing protein [Brumimicrobium glaciale]RYM32525.1 T9SS type A sorting domain-containing protein [Brumimicrobium glaciale]